jgi:uncharacterized protein HemY
LQLDPSVPSIYKSLSRLYIQLELFSKAERLLQQGIEHCPEDSELYELLAKVYQREDNARQERQTLIRAVEQNVGSLKMLLRIAELCQFIHDRKGLKKWLDVIVNSYPDTFQAWQQLGEWYEVNKEWVKAADAWGKAAILGGGDAEFYLKLATLCYHIMRYDPAWRYVVRAEDLGAEVDDLKRKIQIKRLKDIRASENK